MADEEVALTIRMLAALEFVPPNDVIDLFDTFADYSRDVYGQDLEDMLDYFEDNYISRFRHNAPRKRPAFNIETWNMFHRTDNELPRTNNTVEGSHRGFQSHVKTCHPSFWKFIVIMKQEEGLVWAGVLKNQGGHAPLPQRRRYADNHARILRIVDDYANRGKMNYLPSIAHNIDFWEHFQFFFILSVLFLWNL